VKPRQFTQSHLFTAVPFFGDDFFVDEAIDAPFTLLNPSRVTRLCAIAEKTPKKALDKPGVSGHF
jgi:hypothetical protein